MMRQIPDRFQSKVSSQDACLVWTGAKDEKGYGMFTEARRSHRAHRWLWEYLRGPVPEGLELDHLCRNRACVNLAHLEPVTHRENVLRGTGLAARNARKTHCLNGHPLIPDRHDPGRRYCPICSRERKRRHKRSRRSDERAAVAAGMRMCQRDGCSNEIPRDMRLGTKWCSAACRMLAFRQRQP